jgi:hypothetical protein
MALTIYMWCDKNRDLSSRRHIELLYRSNAATFGSTPECSHLINYMVFAVRLPALGAGRVCIAPQLMSCIANSIYTDHWTDGLLPPYCCIPLDYAPRIKIVSQKPKGAHSTCRWCLIRRLVADLPTHADSRFLFICFHRRPPPHDYFYSLSQTLSTTSITAISKIHGLTHPALGFQASPQTSEMVTRNRPYADW